VRGLLIANADDADAGFVGDRFRVHGVAFDECHREHPEEWPDLAGHDVVVTLGSEWSVYWPQVHDLIEAEAALVRAARSAGVPMFGICFGSQVMAHALGGSARQGPAPEIGWHQVHSDDPEVVAEGPWMQWHHDVADLPPGAVEIARSPVGPQAWRLDRVFAVQFHPEATETMMSRWSRGGGAEALERIGSSRDQLLAETRANIDTSRRHAWRLVDRFLDAVAG
jgi:GMP synthase-like glutamine amidotransferase